MKKLVAILVLISIIVIRLVTRDEETHLVGERVRVSIPTIDSPEYSDSDTVIRRGKWEVRTTGYTDFIPGEMVVGEGVVTKPHVIEGVVVEVAARNISLIDRVLIEVSEVRRWATTRLQRVMPEPQASLAIGILLGVKREMPKEFYEQLVNTGTLHVVAASGYNVSVVSGVVIAALSQIVGRQVGLMLGIISTIGYVLIAGSSASVVRAGVMGTLSLIGIMLGRVREVKWLLWVTAWIMLMVSPELMTDVGFQLSIAATVGLLYISPIFLKISQNTYLIDNLYPTLAATIATAPIIWWHFGRLSLIGVVVNMLILPVVPFVMLLSTLTLVVTPLSYLLYIPLWWIVRVIRIFG